MTSHWFEPLADHLGSAYLRYSFTKGTANEVALLWDVLAVETGSRVLDVGCGPGRHALALAARGAEVVGVDISRRFIELADARAPENASFVVADARRLPYEGEFDAAISLCQGAFGLGRHNHGAEDHSEPPPGPDPDEAVLHGMCRALRPGGLLAVSAFSAYFQARFLEDTDTFDASTGLNHERTTLRDEDGTEMEADLWTTCWTPRELRQAAAAAGLETLHVWSVTPGDYQRRPPDLDHPEYLLLARRPT